MRTVKWGEYKLGELFDVLSYRKRFDANKVSLVENGGHPYIVRQSTDNGKKGNINENPLFLNPGNTISFGQDTATMFYQEVPYFTGDKIKILKPKLQEFSKQNAQFFLASMRKTFSTFSWGSSRFNVETLKQQLIKLPVSNGKIDFDFMESFIAELEAQRIAELEAYLKVTGLDNYELTKDEENALIQIYKSEWREFKAEQLFTKLKTVKLPYKAKDLPTAPSGNNVLPCLTSSFHNQGLNYYAPRDGATILKHVITVPSNSDVYRAYYQSREFTVLSDAYAIRWRDEKRTLSFRQYLFMVQSINKITDLPIYSYKNKFGGWNTLKEQLIQLPVKDNEIDFALIELFVSAIVKTAIKDVVLYSQRKMSLYQRVSFKDKPVVYSIPKSVDLRVAEDVPAFEYGKGKKNK